MNEIYKIKENTIRREQKEINLLLKEIEEYLISIYYTSNRSQKELAKSVNTIFKDMIDNLNNDIIYSCKMPLLDEYIVKCILNKNNITYKKKRI